MAEVENIISGGENTNPNADILFDIDTGESEALEPEVSTAQEEEPVEDKDAPEEPSEGEEVEEGKEVEEGEEPKEEAKPEESPDEEKPKSKRKKPFILNDGEDSQKLSPNATIKLVVDGQEQDIPLHEVAASYNSWSANQKRFNELKGYEQQLQGAKSQAEEELRVQQGLIANQRNELTGLVANFAKSAKEGRAILGFCELLERCGVEALPVVKEIRKALVENAESYLGLSQEQRMILDAQEEVAYYRQREARDKAQREREAQERSRKEAFLQVSREFGVPSEKAYNDIYTYLSGLKQSGQLEMEITPKVIGEYYQAGERISRVTDAVKRIAPQLADNQEFVSQVLQGAMKLDLTQSELEEAIRLHVKEGSGITAPSQEKKKLSFKPTPSKPTETGQSKGSRKENLFL